MRNLTRFTLCLSLLTATLVSHAQKPTAAPAPPVAAQTVQTPTPAPLAAQQPPQPQQPPTLNEFEQLKTENLQLKVAALSKDIQDFEAVFMQAHPGWAVNIQSGQVVPAQQAQTPQAPRSPARPAVKPPMPGK